MGRREHGSKSKQAGTIERREVGGEGDKLMQEAKMVLK
jgi:hypothetical protein